MVLSREGLAKRDELVDDRADGEDVGPAVGPPAGEDLGGAVVQAFLGRARPLCSSAFKCQEPKSTSLDLAGGGERGRRPA